MLPDDYLERTYAGVTGKIIGVYLGRPFEGWTYERIMAELGEITGYVHERLGVPLVVTDDDIAGTFTFLRALADYDYRPDLTPAQIGQTWLNYLVEGRTVLWWGGLGNSTEHTAYLRLKSGLSAPESGSIACNGKVVAEQIGAQIFIDGWGMICPGDPERAADFARRAASVSHDGEAIYGAQVIAALEALAYVEPDLDRLLDAALALIPAESVICRMIREIREWHQREPDWRAARRLLEQRYGYDRYGGNCHIVPNHGLIILSLLYGADDFRQSLKIVNTSGWDTDCNSGNVGCVLGIKNGLVGIEAGIQAGIDWRGPVADRLYLPSADGGRAISDAVIETYHVVNTARALNGLDPVQPKGGARFHFSLPGAVQGFTPDPETGTPGAVRVDNAAGDRLAIHFAGLAGAPARAATPTFIPPDAAQKSGYDLLASPTLYPGQTVRAAVFAGAANPVPVRCGLYLRRYGAGDQLVIAAGPETDLAPGAGHTLAWTIPDLGGQPVAQIGVQIRAEPHAAGTVYLDYLTWDGSPQVTLARPAEGGTMWRRAWVNAVDHFDPNWPEAYRIIQDRGTGLLIQGTREWANYRVTSTLVPHMVTAAGIGARVQGLRRYYALLLHRSGTARLVKELDGTHLLAEVPYPWALGSGYALRLDVDGAHLRGWIGGDLLFDVRDESRPLLGGGVALIGEEGRAAAEAVRVEPLGA